ncbi:MAG: beta strand repeat-containing protein, partial [Erythrobacteraceae bacterium]
SLSIGGDAIAFAQGEGGDGGQSDGQAIVGGRGGDGYGGEFTLPNQADPAFNSGAFILAGGDNGTIRVTGEAVALASGCGGQGGNGGSVLPGGEGGDGFGGLAQVGLALLGQNGSLGEGSANFTLLFAEANGVGGSGGFSIFSFPTGNGGDGTGGRALLQSSAGSVSADMAEMRANGFGGEGARGGNGTGGERSGAVTNRGGTITLNSFFAYAHGSGGAGFGLGGGNGLGGQAFMGFQGGTTLVNGDVIVDATGFGGAAFEGGAGGTGTGGIADLAIFTPSIGSGTITGNAAVVANGIGGDVGTDGSIGGFGIGGRAFIQSQVGGTVRIGSAQVTASGRGGGQDGGNFLITGGNGTGGIVELLSTGAGSQLIIERNVSQLFANELNAGAILASLGLGADTTGGSGIGGTGRGGTATVSAQQGGSLVLPSNPLGDPDTVGEIRMTASGFGGGASAEGGRGGFAVGGIAAIDAIGTGSRITMGETIFNVFAQAGSSLSQTSNITGGNAFGGQRIIRVLNGGEASLALVGGNSGGEGGDGSGTGNGGNVFGGSNRVELRSGTLNIRGVLSLEEQSTGGNGARGGDVLALPIAEGGGSNFDATDSTINVTSANGFAGIAIGGTFRGGDGSSAGGNAFAPEVNFALTNTDIADGFIRIAPRAEGGNVLGQSGQGGNATGGAVRVNIIDSSLDLVDDNLINPNAQGGDGGTLAGSNGGSATGGSVRVALDNSTIAVQALNNALATLRVRSFAVGGDGSQVGDATARTALLELTNAAIRAGELTIESGAGAMSQSAGGIGGTARANTAQVAVQGASLIDATTLGVFSNANTSGAGTAIGGVSALTVASGGLTQITTSRLVMVSDGVLSTAAAGNVAGQVDITVASGNVTAGELFASARGNLASGVRSQIVAQGGSFNVTNAMRGRFEGDLLVRTGAGGIIGSAPVAASTTAIQLETRGTLEVLGDGSATGGLGGQSINLNAGRSILLNGNLATANGPVTLTANAGGAQPLATPPVSVITMAQGARINAGTGTVTIRLLDGAGDPQQVNGAITLANILGGRIDVSNLGTSTGSNISVLAGGVLSASGTGRAIDLASLNGEVINLAGDAGLVLTGGGHYGIFAATPSGSQIGSFANYARRYNVAASTAYDTLNPGGNFAAFRIAPVLTVTANNATRFYGSADPVFTASFTGFQPGDGVAGISGTPQFTTSAAATSNIGTFTLNAALGSLLSEQGYQFTFNPGLLTITARPITVTANNLSRIYGNANPALTFTVGGQGLANGDQLSGALATTANATTGVGTVAITQGSLAASSNYQLTFVGGLLTITQRLLTVTADDLSKLLGEPDPDLTFVVSGGGLVNGDQLTGVLVRDPGEAISTFAIRQGTLNAGSNYAISFVEGTLTINAPPAPPSINNPSVIDAALQSAVQDPPLTAEEEEERFGMDFPDQPEASLISEDPLLDDPVSSGGDASLYSGGTTPEPRGEEK